MMALLQSKSAKILSVVLLAQAGAFYGMSRAEVVPPNVPLAELPQSISSWQTVKEWPIEPEVLDVLRADETLSRSYSSPNSPYQVHMFVAYFRSQRTGQAPHSPKNCLPGAGWVPTESSIVQIPVDGRAPIEANKYVIAKGESKNLVLYWYQSRDRVVASEYRAKMYVVADSMRYNRSDTALVRVMVPIAGSEEQSMKVAEQFVQATFNPLRKHFPA